MVESPDAVRTVSYAERWSNRARRAVDPLDADTAHERHASGALYTAVLGDPDHPDAYLEVRLEAGFVGVHFLDDRLRNSMSYLFAREPGSEGDLFLEQVTRREYDDGELVLGEAYFFERDGSARVEKKDYRRDEVETYEVRSDPSANWEPVPEFGRYESIARVERE